MRQNSFLFLIVEDWNSLPDEVVSVKTVRQFKTRLDRPWMSRGLMTQKFIDNFSFLHCIFKK